MQNVYDVLMERGFIEQVTHEEELRELLGREKVVFYVALTPLPTAFTWVICCP